MRLGRIEEVSIRELWKHEQYDFSKWLAEEDNMQLLSEALGLSLTDIQSEQSVGSYRCDLICKDEITGKTVIIENQLEQTNHDHLGKIITYASGLDASVIVWIVANARSEHASAVEWLNKHTDDEVSFFLVEIHAYKIGNSDPAPMFKIIEKPNDFSKAVKALAEKGELNESQRQRMNFWNIFNDVLDERGTPFNKRKATTDHWYSIALGSSRCHISIELVNKEHKIRVGIVIGDDKDLFDYLYENKDEIESAAGMKFNWDRLDGKKAATISISFKGLDFKKHDNYPDLMNKSIDYVVAIREAFKPFVQEYNSTI